VQESKGLRLVRYFVAQIVTDAAVGIDGLEMRPQRLGQKPRRDMKVLVMRLGQPTAVRQSFPQRWRFVGNAVRSRERFPAPGSQFLLARLQWMIVPLHG